MDSEEFQTLLAYLKTLAHESRLRLLGILADGEWSVGELAELLDVKEPTVSHHLAKMLELDLVRMRPVGTTHLYSLNGETLQRLNRDLLNPAQVASIGADVVADAWERKVLKTFLDGERLTKIPDQRKKRLVILKWLVERFQPGERYGELQVNEIIKQHHSDTATLRREMVAEGLLQREASIYWRNNREVPPT